MIEHIDLYRTALRPCAYLPGRMAASVFVDPTTPLSPEIYAQLLERGFRRSGSHVYRPWCQSCRRCIPVRIPVEDFVPARRHRRTWRRNRSLRMVPVEPGFQEQHYALYRRYTAARHAEGDMAHADVDEYRAFLLADWADTRFLEFRDGRDLLAVAVTDVQPDSLSALYTFFHPAHGARSLGVQAILQQIAWARQMDRRWLYLGYWIEGCQKMAYKADYRPLETLSQGRWRRFAPGERIDLPELSP